RWGRRRAAAVADDALFAQWARRVRTRLLWARWSALGGLEAAGGDPFCEEVERAAELPDPVERLVSLLDIADRVGIPVWLSPTIAAALDAADPTTTRRSR